MILKKWGKTALVVMLLTAALGLAPAYAVEEQAPAQLQAALILKLMPLYNNLGAKSYTIHVIGAPDVAKELKAQLGKSTGKATLTGVTSSDGLPTDGADVIYIGSHAAEGVAFSQQNGVLSITGDFNFVKEGVTLGIGLEDKKPKIYLNLSSSKKEGADWNPAILKVAKTV